MKKSRTSIMQQASYELGMLFDPKPTINDVKLLSAFRLFKKGHSKKITNHLLQTDPMLESKEQIFDYQYTIQAGNTPVTKKQTVLFIQSTTLELPIFYLRPETWMDRLSKYLGWDDIDFVQFPEFSQKYYLTGEEEDLVRKLFHDNVLHYFTMKDGWHMEGIGFFLILYKEGKLLDADGVRILHEIGKEAFHLFK